MSTVSDLPASARLQVGKNSRARFGMDPGGTGMSLTWSVPWDDSPAFLEAVIGYAETINGLTRRVPLQNPFIPSLYAVAIADAQFVGADDAISDSRPFAKVIYTIAFEALPWATTGEQAFVSLSHSGSSRAITVPGTTYAISGGTYSGRKIEQDVGIAVGGVAVQLTLHQLPSLPTFVTTALPLVGKVNSVDLVVAGITYAAGSVLFETFDTQTRVTNIATTHEASITLVYSGFVKWNQVIDPGGSASSLTPVPFVTADLSALVM